MARDLNRKIGDMEFDGLITDLNPPVQTRGGLLSRRTAATVWPRGTILARHATNGRLFPLGTTGEGALTPHSILCDDTNILTTGEVSTVVYTAGCFHPNKVTAASGYVITETDLDNLRMRNIVFKLPHKEA